MQMARNVFHPLPSHPRTLSISCGENETIQKTFSLWSVETKSVRMFSLIVICGQIYSAAISCQIMEDVFHQERLQMCFDWKSAPKLKLTGLARPQHHRPNCNEKALRPLLFKCQCREHIQIQIKHSYSRVLKLGFQK